jgi:peptidoglycan hydrolase-like protein with peptidoglycan-binding domain
LAKDPALYPEGKITGVFDAPTKQAVGRFQAKHKLVQSTARGYGILGKQTVARMNSLCRKDEIAKSIPASQVQEIKKNERVIKEEAVKKTEKTASGEAGQKMEPQDLNTEKNWVQVQFPNGGEEFFTGRNYTISWTSSKAERVNIGVADEKGVPYVLARDVANEGKYLWVVPPYFSSGDYKIRVAIPDVTNLAIDESDMSFTVRSKEIDVVAPQDGEVWLRGNTYKMLWQTTGVQNVKIEIIDQNGDARSLSVSVPNESTFSWKVPQDWQLGQYKFRVTDVSSDAFSKPDSAESGYITIQRPPLPITIINPHDATNMVHVSKGQKSAEFLRFNILGDEDIVLKEFTLDDKQSGILDSLFENFMIHARGDLPVALKVGSYNPLTGRRIFAIDSVWKVSARNLPLSVRADTKQLDAASRKEFTVSIVDIKGEGVNSQNPVVSRMAAQGTVIYNPKQ